ncbi:MAG: PKD domain-containing protein [Bacteroidales bacterium]|nr:PKD domain-containing protein [Bacteroidales bacterium]
MNKYKIIIVWVLVGCLSISASAQLEFSNWIVGKNTILHIEPDGSTRLVTHDGINGDNYYYIFFHLLSDKNGTPIVKSGRKYLRYSNGLEMNGSEVNTINYVNNEPVYENDRGIWTTAEFMLKSPDNKYSYIIHNTFTYDYEWDVETDIIKRIGKTQIRCFCRNNLDNTDKGEDFIVHEFTHIKTYKHILDDGGSMGTQDGVIEYPLLSGMSHTDGKSIWIITKSGYEDSLVAINMNGKEIIKKNSSYLPLEEDETIGSNMGNISNFNITDNGIIHTVSSPKKKTIYIYFDQDKGVVSDFGYADLYITNECAEFSTTGKYIYFSKIVNNQNKERGLFRIKTNDLVNGHINIETISGQTQKISTMRIGIDGNIYVRNGKSLMVIYDSETDNPRLETLYTGDDIPDSDIHFPNYLYTYDLFACNSDCDRNATFSFPDPRNEIIAYEWDFGDGAKSTETTPTHQYEVYGSYTVSLKVTLKNGTYKILPSRKIILLDQKPSAQFDNAQVCNGEPLKIILNGNAPYNIFYTFNGENKTITTSDTEYQMDNIAGRYQITKVADQMCETSIKENNTAEILPKLKKITIKANND